MARQKKIKSQKHIQKEQLFGLLLILPALLIKLGESVRGIFSAVLSLLKTTYNLLSFVSKETFRASSGWFAEKQATHLRPGRVRIVLPKLATTSTVVANVKASVSRFKHWCTRAVARIPKRIRIIRPTKPSLPSLTSLPSLPSLPRVSLPNISRVAFPKLPRLMLPETTMHPLQAFAAGILAAVMFLFIPYATLQWLKALPNPEMLTRRDLEVTTKIYDRNGALLYEIYADQNRTPLKLADIPDHVKHATIAIEDREFYWHQGISIRGIIRAMRETMVNKRLQGGSTITQQLIKSALLSPEIKLTRKLKEMLLAFWAERLYTKDQILEMYLNQVPYGGTAWGVEAASQTYFAKSVKNLSLAEAALLAGLPAAPTEYSPFGSKPELAFVRQKEVLRRMVEDRYITKKQADEALATKVQFAKPHIAIRAPHFVMYVKNILEKRYGERLVEQGGLRIVTSLDIGIQEKVEDIVRTQIDGLQYLRVGNGATLVTNPKTGEILAMVGSRNYFDLARDGNVNVTTSLRQPGSSIKVVTYATALENGFTAASILDDSPIVFPNPGSVPYAPVNYDSKFHGPTPLRYALGNSYNIPAVRTLNKLGLTTMMQKAKHMGIDSWEDENRYGLSLTLGGGEVTMLEMAKVFGTLSNEGKRMELLPILEVTDYTGRVFERNKPKVGMQALRRETAWIMSNILSDNQARTAAFGPNSSLVIPGKTVSVKTGTTNEKRDNWTIGYTPSFLAAVWVGNNDNSPMDPYLTSGITGAAPIWHDIMVELLKDKAEEVMPKPEAVLALPCYFGRQEYFIAGTEPAGGRCAPLPTPMPSPSPTPPH